MRQNVDLPDRRIGNQHRQQLLEGVARQRRAFAVVAVGEHACARRPSEQDRRHLSVGVVHDLGEAENGVAEAIVIAVNEDQDAMLARRRSMGIEPAARAVEIEAAHLGRHKVGRGISWRRARQLDLAGRAGAVGRDRHDDIGEAQRRGALAGIELAGIGGGAPRRRHEEVHARSAGNRLRHRHEQAFGRAGASREPERNNQAKRLALHSQTWDRQGRPQLKGPGGKSYSTGALTGKRGERG